MTSRGRGWSGCGSCDFAARSRSEADMAPAIVGASVWIMLFLHFAALIALSVYSLPQYDAQFPVRLLFNLADFFCYNGLVSAQDPAIKTSPRAGQTPTTVETIETIETQPVERPPRRGREPLQALRNRDFRLYWVGNFVSQAGSQMRIVAVSVQLWDLTHNPAALSLLGAVKLVPLLAF